MRKSERIKFKKVGIFKTGTREIRDIKPKVNSTPKKSEFFSFISYSAFVFKFQYKNTLSKKDEDFLFFFFVELNFAINHAVPLFLYLIKRKCHYLKKQKHFRVFFFF